MRYIIQKAEHDALIKAKRNQRAAIVFNAIVKAQSVIFLSSRGKYLLKLSSLLLLFYIISPKSFLPFLSDFFLSVF